MSVTHCLDLDLNGKKPGATSDNGFIYKNYTVGGIVHICFKWFQITADAHPGVPWVSNDQKFCEKFKNTHCQVDHPTKIE